METQGQDGFPDILMLRGPEYLLIESKRLKTKKLVTIEDNLKFEFGQLPFAKRAFTLNLSYLLVVVKHNTIAFIGDKTCMEAYL